MPYEPLPASVLFGLGCGCGRFMDCYSVGHSVQDVGYSPPRPPEDKSKNRQPNTTSHDPRRQRLADRLPSPVIPTLLRLALKAGHFVHDALVNHINHLVGNNGEDNRYPQQSKKRAS